MIIMITITTTNNCEAGCCSCLFRRSVSLLRLEVVGTRKNGRARRTAHVSPSRAPVLSFAHYFQAPATQAKGQ